MGASACGPLVLSSRLYSIRQVCGASAHYLMAILRPVSLVYDWPYTFRFDVQNVAGGHDDVIRVWTRDPSRAAPDTVQVEFTAMVQASAEAKRKGPSSDEISKLPRWETRGAKVRYACNILQSD
jgi:hypothetical protein